MVFAIYEAVWTTFGLWGKGGRDEAEGEIQRRSSSTCGSWGKGWRDQEEGGDFKKTINMWFVGEGREG